MHGRPGSLAIRRLHRVCYIAVTPFSMLVMTFDVWGIPQRLTRSAAAGLDARQLEEVRARLSRREEGAIFNASEAAIYLGRSVRTLKRAIDAGMGPARQKNPDAQGTGATNRHTHYRKADLDLWAATLYSSGSSFASRFADFDSLIEDQPWVVTERRVFCHLLDAGEVEDILEVLARGWVEFHRLEEILLEQWAGLAARQIYQDQLTAIVQRTIDAIFSAQQKDALFLEMQR